MTGLAKTLTKRENILNKDAINVTSPELLFSIKYEIYQILIIINIVGLRRRFFRAGR